MSPARVQDRQIGPTPTNPFMRYFAGLTCDEHPEWHLTWRSDNALTHLANILELEDMATDHNDREHAGAPAALVQAFTPTTN